MKLKSKLLLASTCLLTMSVAASATSAYAWIVANRQAFVSLANVNLKTNASSLKVAVAAPDEDDTNTAAVEAKDTSTNPSTIASTTKITDISGDGKTFFKPTFPASATGNQPTSATKIVAVDQAVEKCYHQFDLTFTQTNPDAKTAICFSPSTIVTNTEKEQASNHLQDAMRIAILDSTKDNVLWYYGPNETNFSGQKYLKAAKPEGGSMETGEWIGSVDSLKNTLCGTFEKPTVDTLITHIGEAQPTVPNGYLGFIGTGGEASLTVCVRVWLEGMDADCVNDNLAETVDLALNFDGYDVDVHTA